MKWFREIDLNTMTAYMKFSTGETYLYKCDNYKSYVKLNQYNILLNLKLVLVAFIICFIRKIETSNYEKI